MSAKYYPYIVLAVVIAAVVFLFMRNRNAIDMLESNVQVHTPTTNNAADDLSAVIQVGYPQPNQLISSPLQITGQARGTWFFEASFPVKLIDANGKEVTSGVAEAQGDWMTDEFVPFVAILNYPVQQTGTGTLILQKDNPSGLPENDQKKEIPVVFTTRK